MTGYRGTPRCTIRTRGQDHLEAIVGSGGIPQCWCSGMPGRLHIWRTHPADLHPGRAQGDLRAQRRLMVQGRLGGWLLRASVSSLRPASLARSSERGEPEGAAFERATHPLRADAGCARSRPDSITVRARGLLRRRRYRGRVVIDDQPASTAIPVDKAEPRWTSDFFAVADLRKGVRPRADSDVTIDANTLFTQDSLVGWRHGVQYVEVLANRPRGVTKRGRLGAHNTASES